MRYILLVPGIMGSRLAIPGTNPREVWPPTIKQATFGYGDIAPLERDDLVATDVVRDVGGCYEVYESLIERLKVWGYDEGTGAAGRLICFPYDWRRDNRVTAALLSAKIRKLHADDGQARVVLLAHSMGGLISKYALEVDDPKLGPVTWRTCIEAFITMGTPFRGAPLALIRILGKEGSSGLSAEQVKRLADDPRYPSSYQLLPSPASKAVWERAATKPPLGAVDILDAKVASKLKLQATNATAARDFHAAIAAAKAAANCRYFNFIGREFKTIVRCELGTQGAANEAQVPDGGDGTVPFWSGTLANTQYEYVGDEHGRTFRSRALLRTLAALLSVPPSATGLLAQSTPTADVMVAKPVVTQGETLAVRLKWRVGRKTTLLVMLEPIEPGEMPRELTRHGPVPAGQGDASFDIVADILPGAYALRVHDELSGRLPGDEARFAVQQLAKPSEQI